MDRIEHVVPHYPSPAARRADLVVHLVGLILACVGGAVIVPLASARGGAALAAVAIYAVALVLMLSVSLAYNVATGARRALLRRLDHSGIFLMIAGSYTPFTTLALHGRWAWGMTAGVWSLTALGIGGKLFAPELRDGLWVALYLALGWIVVIAIGPIAQALSRPAFALLIGGGVVYSLGVPFHLMEDLRFSRSIWHGHVVAGAGVHWAAVLIGTVLRA